MTGIEFIFYAAKTPREELIDSLLAENETAKRMLPLDRQGRPNGAWAESHEFINTLLTLLEMED